MSRTSRVLVSLFVVLAACGGTDSTGSTNGPQSTAENPGSPAPESTTTLASPGEVDPCGFISDAEMSQVLGLDVVAAATGPATCDYASPESGEGISLNVENVAGDGCEPVFDVAGYGSTGGEPVDGIGSYAKFGDGFVPQLAVCFDDQLTLIASLGVESADPRSSLIAVAEVFEANIP